MHAPSLHSCCPPVSCSRWMPPCDEMFPTRPRRYTHPDRTWSTLCAPCAQVYNNRTVGVQHVVEAGGCLILAVTGAQGVCLQDSTFSVHFFPRDAPIPAPLRSLSSVRIVPGRPCIAFLFSTCRCVGPAVGNIAWLCDPVPRANSTHLRFRSHLFADHGS